MKQWESWISALYYLLLTRQLEKIATTLEYLEIALTLRVGTTGEAGFRNDHLSGDIFDGDILS